MGTPALVEILSDPIRTDAEKEAAQYELSSRGYFSPAPELVSVNPEELPAESDRQERAKAWRNEDTMPIGCWLVPALLGLWLAYVLAYAPTQASAGAVIPKMCFLENRLTLVFPNEYPRIELMEAKNIDIYIHRKEFEAIPYPDRESALRDIGKSWDNFTKWYYFSSVRIRDIQTGKDLATYSCTTGRVSLKSDGWF